jgi:hypothetical protein
MADDFDKIIAASVDSKQNKPVEVEGEKKGDKEKAWLFDEKSWLALLKLVPDKVMKKDPLLGLKIGDKKGWLAKKLQPVVIPAFKSIPIDQAPPPPLKPKPGKNHTGLATYGDSYVLWRHATHYNHDPHGGPEVTGKYDAMEGFKLTDEMAAKYVAANKL